MVPTINCFYLDLKANYHEPLFAYSVFDQLTGFSSVVVPFFFLFCECNMTANTEASSFCLWFPVDPFLQFSLCSVKWLDLYLSVCLSLPSHPSPIASFHLLDSWLVWQRQTVRIFSAATEAAGAAWRRPECSLSQLSRRSPWPKWRLSTWGREWWKEGAPGDYPTTVCRRSPPPTPSKFMNLSKLFKTLYFAVELRIQGVMSRVQWYELILNSQVNVWYNIILYITQHSVILCKKILFNYKLRCNIICCLFVTSLNKYPQEKKSPVSSNMTWF